MRLRRKPPTQAVLDKLSLLKEPTSSKFKILFNDMKVTPISDEAGALAERPALHNFAVTIRGKERGWWQIVRGHGRWAARWIPNA